VLGTTTARGHRNTFLYILLRPKVPHTPPEKKNTKKSRISPPTPGFKVVSILFLCSFLVAMCHVVVIKLFTVLDDIPI
jgi:hypothetical protein